MSIFVNRNIRFIDSHKFCKGSLDTIASYLADIDFKHFMTEILADKLEIRKRNRHTLMSG